MEDVVQAELLQGLQLLSAPGGYHNSNHAVPVQLPDLLLEVNKLLGNKVNKESSPDFLVRWRRQQRKSCRLILIDPLPFRTLTKRFRGVAVGSSIGHAIGSMFGGGSGAAQQDQGDSAFTAQHDNSAQQNQTWGASACENDAKAFTRCMNEHQGNLQICNWYLDQLVGTCHLGLTY